MCLAFQGFFDMRNRPPPLRQLQELNVLIRPSDRDAPKADELSLRRRRPLAPAGLIGQPERANLVDALASSI